MDIESKFKREIINDIIGREQKRFLDVTASSVPTEPGAITLRDLRETVISIPQIPKLSWVRVSDNWWVFMEDEKPTAFAPHSDLMKVIEKYGKKL